MKPLTLTEVCQKVNGRLKGNPGTVIHSVNSLERAGAAEITFCVKSSVNIASLAAAALIVSQNSTLEYHDLIYVDEPYAAFAALLEYFFPHRRFNDSLDVSAHISSSAVIGQDVSIGAFSYIGNGCIIGDHCQIHANVTIYPGVKIGSHCLIYAHVVIREDVEVGDHVIIQPGAVIGADGFGFTRLSDGTPVKIPQKGKVKIGSYCEIGANTCIDRSTIEETVLEDYVKLDNLVQIGHNVRIGRGTAISAQCGIAGSSVIGENVIMGGQVGVSDHARVTSGVMIAARAGVHGNVNERGVIAGTPHQPIKDWKRSIAIFKNLETYIEKIKELENKIKELEGKIL